MTTQIIIFGFRINLYYICENLLTDNENRHLDGKPLTLGLWLEMKNKMRTIFIILSTILIVFYN